MIGTMKGRSSIGTVLPGTFILGTRYNILIGSVYHMYQDQISNHHPVQAMPYGISSLDSGNSPIVSSVRIHRQTPGEYPRSVDSATSESTCQAILTIRPI